ncbi:MAG: hypothetical protein JNJ77_14085 [Planctomycetia bacterium]|nr:hypothetical protein [Planctomycetia bacterium]
MKLISPVSIRLFLPAFLLMAWLQNPLAAQPSSAFAYQPGKVTPGTLVQYVKSNLDGSKPSLITMYIADADCIEVYKSEKGLIDAADVIARMDWSRFSFAHLDGGVVTRSGKRESRATVTLEKDKLLVKIGTVSDELTVSVFPVHVYNFDLMSLNVTLPYLKNPAFDFQFSIVEPTFRSSPPLVEDRGSVLAKYVKAEKFDGIDTWRYEVRGKGMKDQLSQLWINQSDGFLQKWESPVPNNPGWNSLKLVRQSQGKMNRDEWNEYKKSNIGTGMPAQK